MLSRGPFFFNVEDATIKNTFYRKVVKTTDSSQLVLMNITPEDEGIETETHPKTTQLIRIESGEGVAILKYPNNTINVALSDGVLLYIDPGVEHTILNLSKTKPLQLYSIYSPPEHPPNTKQKRRQRK